MLLAIRDAVLSERSRLRDLHEKSSSVWSHRGALAPTPAVSVLPASHVARRQAPGRRLCRSDPRVLVTLCRDEQERAERGCEQFGRGLRLDRSGERARACAWGKLACGGDVSDQRRFD